MAVRKRNGALTKEEKKIVKRFLIRKWRNQDIQALVNIGRKTTINSARITEVKNSSRQRPSTEEEADFYLIKKKSFDHSTGLNLFDDERLIRAREAMILAVHTFNSPAVHFKTEVFSVLANIAWTYLLHEYFERKKINIIDKDGRSLLLSNMIERQDCPLSEGTRNNLRTIKAVRDDVEHLLLGKGDIIWVTLYQACCLNFDRYICKFFGDDLSLTKELSLALQFSKLSIDQISNLNKHEIPEHIKSIDSRLNSGLTQQQQDDLDYQFSVVFTLNSSSKSRSHIQFIRPDTAEGKNIQNILVKEQSSDHLYPYKPAAVCSSVSERSGIRFSLRHHTQAWKLYKCRPKSRASQPENTDKRYCIYHPAHRDYTYSEKWVEFLVECIINNPEAYQLILSVKI